MGFWDGSGIYTSLQTDNHTNTPLHNINRQDAFPDAQPKVSEDWRNNYFYLILFC